MQQINRKYLLDWREAVALLLVFFAVNFLMGFYQLPVSNKIDSKLLDKDLLNSSINFANNEAGLESGKLDFSPGFPTAYFVGKFFRDDINFGWFLINILLLSATLFLLWFYLASEILNPYIRALLMVVAMSHWLFPMRWIYFEPVSNIALQMIIVLSTLIILKSKLEKQHIYLSILATIASLFSYFALLIGILYLIKKIGLKPAVWSNKISNVEVFVPLLTSFSVLIVLFTFSPTSFDFSSVQNSFGIMYDNSIFKIANAVFNAWGAIFFLGLFYFRQTWEWLRRIRAEFVLLLILMILSLLNDNMEQILILGLPVILIIAGKVLEAKLPVLFFFPISFLLISSQMLTNRVFWTLPTFLNETVESFTLFSQIGVDINLHNLFVQFAITKVNLISFGQYLWLGIILYVLIYYRDKSLRNRELISKLRKLRNN